MKAISLSQPWGSLIIDGRKKIETRDWPTRYRGPVAIHAAKSIDKQSCFDFGYDAATIPRGVILGTAELFDCFQFNMFSVQEVSEEEKLYGDYAYGRYGFRFRNIVRFDLPVLAKGKLGLWEWEPNGDAVKK